ncbi:hypothetical protein CBR_g50102 [Chara braunii]|uniref:Reverse transcriptase domain-containing protein n=1 Tax=Chara braunii TaxID=69332 RepID=A0A388M6A1_CHABU|nr:hypothetical protein CBR_g50102 [Chara braunii]|eukprot:GBG90009.1 hypothetical protein CBR_g50102 [Chara braunii]
MNKEDFTTIGAFVQKFKKKARKVHGISEEAQCAIFLGLLTASEAVELTRHGGGSTELTWATIDRGVEVGCLDQVEQRQVRLQRQKRKERDATASRTPGVTRSVTDVLAQLGYATKPVVQRRVVTAVKVKGKKPVIEEAVQEELWEEEEPVPQHLTKVQRKVRNLAQGGQGSGKAQAPQAQVAAPLNVAAPSSSTGPSQGGAPSYGQWPWPVINAIVPWGSPPPVAGPQTSMPPLIYPAAQAQPVAPPSSPAPSSQGSVAGGGNQGQGNQGNGERGGGRGRGRNGRGRGRQWNGQGQGYQGQGNQGQGYQGQGSQGQGYQGRGYQGQGYQGQGDQGSQGYGRPRFDWRTAICQHCGQQGHTIRFCNIRREDERSGLISSTMDGNIYDQFGEAVNRRLGGVRAEAQRRAAAGPLPPAMFRLWQEKEEPPIGMEEVESDKEVAKGLRGGSKTEEPIIIESDDEDEEERMEPPCVLFGKMEDLLDKMGRYQRKLVGLCEEVKGWKSNIPKVFLYDSGPESAPKRPGVNVVGSCPQSGMRGRPLTPQARLTQAARRGIKPRPVPAKSLRGENPNQGEGKRLWKGRLKQGSQRRYKTVDKKCRPVPVLVTEDEEAYYKRERGLIRRMRESTLAGPCRINDENEEELIIGEPDFLLPQERTLMVKLMKRRHRAYAFSDEERGTLDVDKIPMIRIHTVPHEPWNMRGARYPNPDEEKKVVDYLDGKISTHVADYSSGPYASPWFCFIKPNGTLRWVQDLQRLNAVTVRDGGGLPNADALSESCAGRPIISLIDLYSEYDQFPVYPPDRPVTAMHTPRGLIRMNVAPQGWTNAVAMVQRAMIRVMQSVSPHITQPYIDDLAVKGPTVKESDEVLSGVRRFVWEHIQDLEKVLSLLEEHNLTASGAKSRHCTREATILGFICSEKGRRPDVKKTDKITEWLVPFHSVTDVRSFLGTCGFWRVFVNNFAAKTEHLRKLVRQDQEWVWGEEQEQVVARMKEEFREGGLVLGASDYDATETRPFIVETDAGPTALGGVLIQGDMEGKERPLRFENRTLCTTERNYSQFKRETLVVLHCLRIFQNYIFGRRFIFRVDPTALAYSLRNYVPSDPTVARWLTYIWMFNFELERIPGSKNRADGLSRINWDKQEGEAVENTPPVDGFLDQEEDVRLYINKWSPRVPNCVGYPIWQTPSGYERRDELVLKPFDEEDHWGGKDVQLMMELALASSHSLVEDMRTIEEGPCQESLDQSGSLNPAGNVDEVPESQDDEFEEGEIKEAFCAEEYDGIYLELGLLLSYEIRLRDASDRAQRILQRYLVRDGHLFVRREVGNPRRDVYGRNRQIDVVAALHDGIAGGHRGVQATYAKISELSDFTKTAMPRGGRETRPPWRPLGASGGYERHGSRHRESTPVYDDGDIKLFLDTFWDHARRMGWTVTQAIEGLRGVGRFEEPVARIRREATTRSEVEWRMQELRPSPVGPDGRPIRLEIENVADFIPAFEWFMQGQGIPRDEWARTLPLWTRKAERALATQVRDIARDWESCRAHLREAFRRPEPTQPRVERRQRSQRLRDPEPREARPSRGGRKALARREEEPEPEPDAEERGAYPECRLGPVEFHQFTEGGLRRSPARAQEEPPASEGPLKELVTHLDISQWRASPRGEKRGEQAEEVPQEEVPREEVSREVQDTQRERGLGDVGRRAGKEVIEVGEDTPPQTPAVGLRLGDAPGSTRQAEERLQSEEVPFPSSEKAPSLEGRAGRRRERASVRREALTLIDRHLAAYALEHPDLEEPAPAEPRQEPCQPEKEMEAEIPKRVDLRTRERAPAGETAEEKRARRTRRIDEIWQERQRLEAAGAGGGAKIGGSRSTPSYHRELEAANPRKGGQTREQPAGRAEAARTGTARIAICGRASPGATYGEGYPGARGGESTETGGERGIRVQSSYRACDTASGGGRPIRVFGSRGGAATI